MIKPVLVLFLYFLLTNAYGQTFGLEAYWDDGLQFRSKDSLSRFSVGGRVHYDIAFSEQSDSLDSVFGNVNTKVEVRRARLSFEGSINKVLEYEFEFTFGETLEYADMYFAFLRVPFVERLTIGHFREPFGMEEMTSSNSIVFMERSLTSAFGPSRNTGIMLQRQFFNQKLRGYASVFRITDDLGGDVISKGDHSVTSRLVYTPLRIDDSRVLHFGLSHNRVTPDGQNYRVRTSNEVNTNPNYVSTGDLIGVQTVNQLGWEFGYTKGPLCIQSEYIQSVTSLSNSGATIPNKELHQYKSFYLITSYFLKGGYRGYSRSNNRFSNIKLTRAPEAERLRGAWEAGLRFSHIDLSDAGQPYNTISNITAGLNWYYNSNTRVMMNYVHTLFTNKLMANTLQFRMQVTF